jgi:hypothetical protein
MNTNLSGTWTGTLTRPPGLGSISVRWVLTQGDQGALSGPLSMTYNGVTVQASLSGFFGGGTNEPAGVSLMLSLSAGASPVVPSCSISPNDRIFISPITAPVTTLTSGAISINYNQCAGFVAPDPNRNFTTDVGSVLTLNKQ